MTTENPPNPFAPGATVGQDDPAAPRGPSRWLAVLGTILCWYPLMGVGHFVMGRPRRWLTWSAVGVVTFALMLIAVRTSIAKLFVMAVVGMALLFLGSVVDVVQSQAGTTAPPFRRALTIVILLFIAGRGIGAATKEWVAEAFKIPSGSMIPNLLVGDHVMVKKGPDVERGTTIVFKYPRDPTIDYLKRVVAVGGEVVEFQKGVVVVNGSPLRQTALPDEIACGDSGDRCNLVREENGAHSYLVAMTTDRPRMSFGPITVPPGQVFVVGDNRDNSSDSRVWGGVPVANVTGTVSLIWWSQDTELRWERIGTVPQ